MMRPPKTLERPACRTGTSASERRNRLATPVCQAPGAPSSGTFAIVDPEARQPYLDDIATDLADVETALERLDDGSYWIDEVTGEPLADSTLADRPTTRRAIPDDGGDGEDDDRGVGEGADRPTA